MTDLLGDRLKLAIEELQTVVEDILISGVEAGFDTVPHHVSSPGRTLQLQHLHRGRHQHQQSLTAGITTLSGWIATRKKLHTSS